MRDAPRKRSASAGARSGAAGPARRPYAASVVAVITSIAALCAGRPRIADNPAQIISAHDRLLPQPARGAARLLAPEMRLFHCGALLVLLVASLALQQGVQGARVQTDAAYIAEGEAQAAPAAQAAQQTASDQPAAAPAPGTPRAAALGADAPRPVTRSGRLLEKNIDNLPGYAGSLHATVRGVPIVDPPERTAGEPAAGYALPPPRQRHARARPLAPLRACRASNANRCMHLFLNSPTRTTKLNTQATSGSTARTRLRCFSSTTPAAPRAAATLWYCG